MNSNERSFPGHDKELDSPPCECIACGSDMKDDEPGEICPKCRENGTLISWEEEPEVWYCITDRGFGPDMDMLNSEYPTFESALGALILLCNIHPYPNMLDIMEFDVDHSDGKVHYGNFGELKERQDIQREILLKIGSLFNNYKRQKPNTRMVF